MKPATLVASPRHRGNTPVAMGSNVPVWPTFFTLSSPRTCRTTSNEVGPLGLSMTRTPSMLLPALLLLHLAQQPLDAVPPLQRLVEGEEHLGRHAQVDRL